jgi:hypothetical protein
MTSFTLAGKHNGRIVEITWSDGRLSGDADIVRLTELRATAPEDQLSDPYTAYRLIQALLDEPEIVSGALPPVAEPPETVR